MTKKSEKKGLYEKVSEERAKEYNKELEKLKYKIYTFGVGEISKIYENQSEIIDDNMCKARKFKVNAKIEDIYKNQKP